MKQFTVQMGITDHFEITVFANDYDQAYDIANNIDVAEWTLRDSNTEYFEISED